MTVLLKLMLPMKMLTLMQKHLPIHMSSDVYLMSMMYKLVEDDSHKEDQVGHLMLLVGLQQMNLMEMSVGRLVVHEGRDVPTDEEVEMTLNIVMLSSPMMMKSVMMDR